MNEIQSMQEDIMYFYESDIHISMLQIAVSVTILSALGAAIDTALSVTSAVYEVKQHRPELFQKELFDSGMQVGKEIIGTTVNTLLFVYLGDSMLLFAYLKKGGYTIETIVNSRFSVSGVVRNAFWSSCLCIDCSFCSLLRGLCSFK